MKKFVLQIYANPAYSKAFEWGKLISITGSAQVLVQIVGFICGILVIHLLPTREYALYTLANAMLGTMILLADSGISAGVMAQGARVWQSREKLGAVLVTGLDLRKKFAIGSLVIATPALLYLLRHHGATWLMSVLIIVSLIPAFFTVLSGTVLEIVLKLRQNIVPLQKLQVINNIGRLGLLGTLLLILPWTFVALLAAGLPQIWANRRLKRISALYVDWDQKPEIAIRKEILVFVKRVIPGALYYCFSGQLTIWLISIFGTSAALAQMGALGRLAMVLSLFGVLFSTLVSPRFARLTPNKDLLLKRFFHIMAGIAVLTLFIVGFTWLFPTQVLWILGKNYSNLKTELVLNIAASCLNLTWGSAYVLGTSRGWTINPIVSIPVSILAIVCGALLIDVTTLKGVLVLNIFVASIELIMYTSYTLMKILQVKEPITN